MGLVLGSLIFLVFEGAGFTWVKLTKSGQNGVLLQMLWATTVICCWMMWAIVYIAQKYPLVQPVLQS